MRKTVAITSIGSEDRAAAFEYDDGVVLVVADGAGGTGHGAQAAESIIAGVRDTGWSPAVNTWTKLLTELDHAVGPGQTTAVVIAAAAGSLSGASVGDSDAWWFADGAQRRLTAAQRRKPLLGEGRATPTGFEMSIPGAGTLILASDGLWKYARERRSRWRSRVVHRAKLLSASSTRRGFRRARSKTTSPSSSVVSNPGVIKSALLGGFTGRETPSADVSTERRGPKRSRVL